MATTALTTLDSTYTTLINYQIQMESQPLTRLTTQQNDLKLKKAIYTDLKTKLDQLLSSTKALISTNAFYSLKSGRTISVANVATGSTVLTASASSSSLPGSYEVSNISLALADRVRSDEQEYADQALGKTGTFVIGGASSRSTEKGANNIDVFGTNALKDGSTKLADGKYYVETRKVEDTWQFRVVNSSGTYQEIDGSGEDGWQTIPTENGGQYDSGRGLTIDFGNDPAKYTALTKSTGATSVTFSSVNDEFSVKSTQNTVSGFSANEAVTQGQLELGKGNYFVETRNYNGAWQFRLVNDEGIAAKIAQGSNGTTYTDQWQSIPTDGGTFNTGRGLSIEFGTDSSKYAEATRLSGALKVNYQAKGAEISVTSDMSLIDIASKINAGTYGSGDEVTATIVNKQLVISSKLTGSAHQLQASGAVLEEIGVLSGSSFKNVMQTAKDATFTVNGLNVTRSQNSALTDVISGVTINLASDAEGKSATVNIASDNGAQKTAMNSFITNFNAIITYLNSKMAVTKNSDNTYTRGALAGDQSIISLKSSLQSMLTRYDPLGGVYKSLREIGIGINTSGSAAILDSTKFENALKNNYADVQKVVDSVMTNISDKLSKYTGTTSYVNQLIKANESQTKSIASQITIWNKRIEARKESLTNTYANIQAQMTELSYTSSTNQSWITSLYSSLYT